MPLPCLQKPAPRLHEPGRWLGCVLGLPWLELQPSPDLNRARGTNLSVPCSEIAQRDVVVEGKTRSLVVDGRPRVEVVLVKSVKEPKTDLEVSAFSNSGVLSNRKVYVLSTWTSQIRDPWARASISKPTWGVRGRRWIVPYEVGSWFERRCIQERARSRIVAVRAMKEWTCA